MYDSVQFELVSPENYGSLFNYINKASKIDQNLMFSARLGNQIYYAQIMQKYWYDFINNFALILSMKVFEISHVPVEIMLTLQYIQHNIFIYFCGSIQ